jgi:hypothetical protein
MNFVAALERFPKIVAARAIDLSPRAEAEEDASTLDVTVSLRAFVFAAPDGDAKKTVMAQGSSNHAG